MNTHITRYWPVPDTDAEYRKLQRREGYYFVRLVTSQTASSRTEGMQLFGPWSMAGFNPQRDPSWIVGDGPIHSIEIAEVFEVELLQLAGLPSHETRFGPPMTDARLTQLCDEYRAEKKRNAATSYYCDKTDNELLLDARMAEEVLRKRTRKRAMKPAGEHKIAEFHGLLHQWNQLTQSPS